MNASTSSDLGRKMEPVALALLGEPQEKHHDGQEWRYGTRGSLSIRIDKGTFYDNEAGVGGGTLDLIQSRASLDKAGALQWLRDRKLIEDREPTKTKARIVANYDYRDETGAPLFQVRRMEPKNFIQASSDGKGGWSCKGGCMKGVRLVPFRLPEMGAAIAKGQTIYIAEGEKGVLSLVSLGLAATCSPGGACKWRADYNRHFAGADVVVLPDNDEPGRQHGEQVVAALRSVARSIRVVTLPDLPLKGDVADWIAAGGTAAQLKEMVNGTADEPPPAAPAIDDTDRAARAIAKAVAGLNEKYLMVSEAGKATIYAPAYDPVLNRKRFDRMSAGDLRLLYLNDPVFVGNDDKGNPVLKPSAEIWLRHKDRRQFRGGVRQGNGPENGMAR